MKFYFLFKNSQIFNSSTEHGKLLFVAQFSQ